MVATIVALGIDIAKSDPSLDEEGENDFKILANNMNTNLIKNNEKRKLWSTKQSQGNFSHMSFN